MHGPQVLVQDKQRKTYLIAIMDDHSRLITAAAFYLSENLKTYLTVLEQAFLSRGLPRKLYVDNGPAFRSHHLKYVAASLSIALIHARPYKPQGKGKIERWFRTVRLQFLQKFTGKTLPDLNTAFDKWLNEIYHQRKHSSTGETPFKKIYLIHRMHQDGPAGSERPFS
jgi:putative transposase